MKNKVIRNFLIFIGFWIVFVSITNLIHHRGIFTNFPWEVLLIFLLALIQVLTDLGKKVIYGIDITVYFIFMLLTGGYYNWTSLIIFALMAVFMSAITYFVGTQFRYGEVLKK
ncbi:hypothetical protein [Companilactobacillus kimchii]|uniref:Integral membrane protein n=1 Tax=Companilactobacillus kimchii TaxID=2801452 RepID=A0A210P7C5_9LACO|nr:hypothetical protein [Companilactobacillus kimchii]KAE9563196.1 hypothetical protein ATN91_00505 [Companilactobacillus kimchii]OWF32372.1 hypothetical protein LKACC12383_02158 [Companilactobacillus kimchii]GEO47238.1 hypothetical protein LKI01_12370 [Companilactobacillus paralimentarius]